MSLFKRKKAGEEANTIPEAMDDITQTLLIPVKDEGEKTMCADAYETSQAEIASYTSIGTRKSQQDSICFDFGDFCTVCAVCDGMGGLTGGERASALAAHGVTRYLLEHAQAEDIPTEMGRAALRLNEEVKNLRDPANQKIEAGTTLTTVFLRNGKLFWCSIGDSHIYLYRDGTLEQLNIDHNFGAQLDQMALEGSITQDEALHHPVLCCSDKLSWDFGADIDQRKPDAVPASEGRCAHSMHGRAVPLSAGQHYVQNFGRDGKSETGGGTDGQNGTCCSRRAR